MSKYLATYNSLRNITYTGYDLHLSYTGLSILSTPVCTGITTVSRFDIYLLGGPMSLARGGRILFCFLDIYILIIMYHIGQ